VKGIEKIAIAISETAKLIKNEDNSDDKWFPFNRTIIAIILELRDMNAVVEYNIIRTTW
jgi:hypothetical protein